MQYESFSLSNGLRIIYMSSSSPVSYCGFAVNAGTRDETSKQYGLAHFVEHLLFKGTQKRKAWHILNRMENVGGELNAYTTKEETFLYSVCLSEDTERAIELLGDQIFHSRFPKKELEKEREVILDEIDSYQDNPSELIFDEFENALFDKSSLGHSILGDEESLNQFQSESCFDFFKQYYQPQNMVFFFYGKMPSSKIIRFCNKYFLPENPNTDFIANIRTIPKPVKSFQQLVNKDLHQSHVMIGGRGYSIFDKNRIGLYLLNNILGGPGMNSRLNLNLRERNGLVYTVESGLTSYTDTGVFSIYFGCDHETRDKCTSLCYKELKKLRDNKLSTSQLNAAIKQLKGQLGIGNDQRENKALGMGKSFLHFNKYDNLFEIYAKIDALNSSQLLAIANDVFDEGNLSRLVFC